MSNLFYPKMAVTNIKKNSKIYFPYIFTCIATIAMFYNMAMIGLNQGIKEMPGGDALEFILHLGMIVIGLFSIIFLFYTNSFLIKRRKKELGLYHVLGMEKIHIAKILFFENIITSSISIVLGLFLGITFSKLIFLLLLKILRFPVTVAFSIDFKALWISVLLFAGIYFTTLIWNLIQIKRTKPVELLKSESLGEKEPKTKKFLALLGFLCIAVGYYIAIVVESPIEALILFFVAVVLVILGTYFIFTAGSIAVLKLLKKNKNYYYKTNNFISISSMIYRMKQNAVGLANICILSTMVLIMVLTTLSLYIGMEEQITNRYPKEIIIDFYNIEEGQGKKIQSFVDEALAESNILIKEEVSYESLDVSAMKEDGKLLVREYEYVNDAKIIDLIFITAEEYERLGGENIELRENEVYVYNVKSKGLGESFDFLDKSYKVQGNLDQFPIAQTYNEAYTSSLYYIVASKESIREINGNLASLTDDSNESVGYYMEFNLDLEEGDLESAANVLRAEIEERLNEDYVDSHGKPIMYFRSKSLSSHEFYALYGGFFFLGMFLGILFMIATALIIYYKQISEGYDDKERFQIMQKVGLSRDEVKNSINDQIKKVFFLPILVAVIHIIAAFKMLTRLLLLFNLTNTNLFVLCTLGTILVFIGIYSLVYKLTARAYYETVGSIES